MKEINGNKSMLIGMAQRGELEEGEVVYSIVNRQAYRIVKESNHQGNWVGVQEVSI